jgi:protein O-GlcNAc transferase
MGSKGKRGFSGGGRTRTVAKRERDRRPSKGQQSATVAMQRAIEIAEDIATAQNLYSSNRWEEAYDAILKLKKRKAFEQPLTYDALGSCLQYMGRIDESLECFRKALQIDPSYVEASNRLIMILDAQPSTTSEQAQRERTRWWNLHGAHRYTFRKPHLNNRDPERPLRIGYVSGDFQYHSAATVFHRIALHHSEGFMPYFYSTTPTDKLDSISNAYMAHAGWRNTIDRRVNFMGLEEDVQWPDTLVADKIRTDQIDILVDLSGYTGMNRLPVFCYKPAPIQITGWGYATGVGWEAMDYLVTDRVVVPEDRQHEHVERMMYLPSVIDYEPVEGLPPANPLPCLTERPTFGVFQRSLKMNSEDVEVWRQILERLPESRVIFKGMYAPAFTQWIKDSFRDQAPQVEFMPVTSSWDHKVAYQYVDLNLDPWPQTGGVSACDALWQGVPAVTLLGPRVIQRTTASLLTTLGLTDFIAHTHEEYIDKAVSWVTTRKHELAEIRQGLRAKCDASPIRQGYREAAEAAYRDVWREWCARPLTLADARYRLEMAS